MLDSEREMAKDGVHAPKKILVSKFNTSLSYVVYSYLFILPRD